MSLFEAVPGALHSAFFGVPEVMGAASTTGGILTGGLQSMAESMMGLTMGKSIYDWAFGGSGKPGAPGQAKLSLKTPAPATSTVSAGPSVTPSANYGSMASPLAAIQSQVPPEVVAGMNQPQLQGLVDQYQRSTDYGSVGSALAAPTPDLGATPGPLPGIPPNPQNPGPPPGPPPPGPQPTVFGIPLSSYGAGYTKMREIATQEAAARKPFSQAPTIRPGPPVPISVGKPLAVRSPLERYALMLRRF